MKVSAASYEMQVSERDKLIMEVEQYEKKLNDPFDNIYDISLNQRKIGDLNKKVLALLWDNFNHEKPMYEIKKKINRIKEIDTELSRLYSKHLPYQWSLKG